MQERVRAIRDYLHSIPEPAGREEKTARWLAGELEKAGYEVQTGVGSLGRGVVGLLKGTQSGPTVALRGDMDALEHVVDGQRICVHSCGHDANCAMVLTLAEELAASGIERGVLKIVFQPAEEGLTGAPSLIEAGVADDMDYLLGVHLRPIQEARAGQATSALYHGSSYKIKASVTGKTAHGARPHLGVNAIDAAAMIVNAVNSLWENPVEAWSAKVTQFNSSGVIINAIPDSVDLSLDVRAQSNDTMKSLLEKIVHVIETLPAAMGAKGTVDKLWGVSAAEYDDETVALLSEGIVDVLGEEGLIPPIITPGSDDFHFYRNKRPNIKTAFLGLGADLAPGLHDPDMSFNSSALAHGVKILRYVVDKLLN
jgi:amidohydrolase